MLAEFRLVDNLIATSKGDKILQNFKPANLEYPLAVHLSGKFKTAFPDGQPKAKDDKDALQGQNPLRESGPGAEVVLVADTDLLNDNVCVRVQNVMGQRIVQPVNGNLSFVQSLVEQLAGEDDLISSRSRASLNRPFTRVKEMEAEAGKQWDEKIRLLETRQRETEQRIKELQTRSAGAQERDVVLSAEQQKELENYQRLQLEVAKDLRLVRKNLRKDTDALEFHTKLINLGAMPVLVAMSGLGLAVVKTKRRGAK